MWNGRLKKIMNSNTSQLRLLSLRNRNKEKKNEWEHQHNKIWVTRVSKVEEIGKGTERIFEEIMADEFSNLMKNINLYSKNLNKIQRRSKGFTKRSTSRHHGQTIYNWRQRDTLKYYHVNGTLSKINSYILIWKSWWSKSSVYDIVYHAEKKTVN